MTKISKHDFYRACKGAKLIKVENFDSAAPYESTAFTYKRKDNTVVHKIETRSLRADGVVTYAYYK